MITHILILSLTSIGICCTMWEGMIFEKFGDWIEKTFGEFLSKPMGKCYVCATFWFSLIICLVVGWPWYLAVPAMGLSAVVSLFAND